MTVTTFDKLLMTIGIGLWVTLILAVVVVFIAIRRNSNGYLAGWQDGIEAALNTHGPTIDDPDARLLWLVAIEPTEPDPYREA